MGKKSKKALTRQMGRKMLRAAIIPKLGWDADASLIGIRDFVKLAERQLSIPAPIGKFSWDERLAACAVHCGASAQAASPIRAKPPKRPKAREAPPDKAKQFYRSYDWRRLRYDILKANDGRCELCGRGKKHGLVLHVDHIKPLRRYWHLRLDPKNLQVLCEECNHGKGNRDETDWRPVVIQGGVA